MGDDQPTEEQDQSDDREPGPARCLRKRHRAEEAEGSDRDEQAHIADDARFGLQGVDRALARRQRSFVLFSRARHRWRGLPRLRSFPTASSDGARCLGRRTTPRLASALGAGHGDGESREREAKATRGSLDEALLGEGLESEANGRFITANTHGQLVQRGRGAATSETEEGAEDINLEAHEVSLGSVLNICPNAGVDFEKARQNKRG